MTERNLTKTEQLVMHSALRRSVKKIDNHKHVRRIKCSGCDSNYADYPSKLCPGCQAYKDHQQ